MNKREFSNLQNQIEFSERYGAFAKEAVQNYIQTIGAEAAIRRLVPNLEVRFPELMHANLMGLPGFDWNSLIDVFIVPDAIELETRNNENCYPIFRDQLEQWDLEISDMTSGIQNRIGT